jgi:hypothetical protein
LEQGTHNPRKSFAGVFAALHIVADARCFGGSAFAARYAELRSFAAEILQTVENDREKLSSDHFVAFRSAEKTAPVIASADCN